ncbi:NAD-dependent epimerase/dehydratase family protein [Bacillus mangrovi]|uniref:NAD-dependent epimerase/dehydratase family protein n=1 Tax=Metabacillus mangrovi TaxID=1491830 RepID=A0A7X2S744_9BACI|nr:nucleoside-diphosphate sugar epimerase/dehydratase [Metabacillus mangrovi]MTH54503.1 NAD-dependent epimerase/dehydratase family protein [Metabacillus mangrovi]
MTFGKRLAFLVFLDSFTVVAAIYLSYFMINPAKELLNPAIIISSVVLLAAHHIFASLYKLYVKAWEYASIKELLAIFYAVSFSAFTTGVFQQVAYQDVYVRILLITWLIHMVLICGTRFCWRIFRDVYYRNASDKKRTLIIGAGMTGTMVARQLMNNRNTNLLPVAFLDDDKKKQNLQIFGLAVAGGIEAIEEACSKLSIETIILAIPSLDKMALNTIYSNCEKINVKVLTIPKMEDIMLGKVSSNEFRDVKVEDLLGREPVELDIEGITETISEKTILVTGAGGSIGSEICRQICRFSPSKIILLGHGENSIYQIDMELRSKLQNEIEIIPVIADIQDRNRIFEIMQEYKPYVVYHAAAHKHVPLMEYNPREAVKNNIFGTKNVAEAADTFGVNTFVLISSDKAVNPPNVMGATKRFAEMMIQHLSQKSSTKFVAVRFGNVLGSRGSVIPLFKKQIQSGGPVTVTHPEMTRYFMTIPEASRLVIQAGSLARGGEIFVLDMGEPVKIVDLAENLIKLSGYTTKEIGMNFSGLRPGEKMYEELLNENEVHSKQIFPKIHIGKAALINEEILLDFMKDFYVLEEGEIRDRLLDMANNRINVTTAV